MVAKKCKTRKKMSLSSKKEDEINIENNTNIDQTKEK